MKRRLFTFASVVSLLLCVGTVALWVRGKSHFDAVVFEKGRWIAGVGTSGGQCGIVVTQLQFIVGSAGQLVWTHHDRDARPLTDALKPNGPGVWTRWGFGCEWLGPSVMFRRQIGVVLPCWVLGVGFAVLPALAAARIRRRHRDHSRRCRKCGYNLTGNTSGVCPECGTAVQQVEQKVTA